MRNVPLADLIVRLKAEIGAALDDGTASDDLFAQVLENKQRWFAATYTWPFLRKQWDVTASGRYTTVPSADVRSETAELDVDMPHMAKVKYGDVWKDLTYGIGFEELSVWDSDSGDTADPILNYQFMEYQKVLQVEVWPVPQTEQTVRIWGQRKLYNLEDGADLDDMLLIYSCAAEFLARFDQKDAQLKAQLANNRLAQLMQRNPQPQRSVVFGRDQDEPEVKVVKITTVG